MSTYPSLFAGCPVLQTAGWYYSSGKFHGAEDWVPGNSVGDSYYNTERNWYLYAPVGGTVVISKKNTITATNNGGYGEFIVIKGNDGYWMLIAHLNSRAVKTGDKVSQGTLLGVGGNTGNSTGRHVHVEIADYRNTTTSTYSYDGFRSRIIHPSDYINFKNTGTTNNIVSSGVVTNQNSYPDWSKSLLTSN